MHGYKLWGLELGKLDTSLVGMSHSTTLEWLWLHTSREK